MGGAVAKRGHISLKVKLASFIIEHFKIDREHARQMTPEMLMSLVTYDHVVYHTWTQDDHPVNLTPRLILDHREKSKTDKTVISKAKRVSEKEEAFRRRLLAKTQSDTLPPDPKKYQWAKGRKIQSRGFAKR